MKRRLRGWAYVAAGLVIMITAMAVFAPDDDAGDGSDVQLAEDTSAFAAQDELIDFGIEQEQLRSMQLTQLDDIINSEKSSQELIDRAQAEKIEIALRSEQETLVTGMLQARGYTDAAAVMGDGYMTVMVRANQLETSDAARITELVITQTGLGAENIKIIPIN